MKQRNVWKMRLSVLLMVVMMLNMTFTAFANWEKKGDEWYYYDESGNMVQGKEKKIQEKWYSFDENGVMRTGWLEHLGGGFYALPSGNLAERWLKIGEDWYYFKEITKGEDGLEGGLVSPGELHEINGQYYYFDENSKMVSNSFVVYDDETFYAQEDGSLAERGWYFLNVDKDGNVNSCDHEVGEKCDCSWYYFRDVKNDSGEYKGMIQDGIKTIGPESKVYAFESDGKMVSQDWYADPDDVTETSYYFQSAGEKATNKWLPIGAYWYEFDRNGKIKTYAKIPGKSGDLWEEVPKTASESNAPYPVIESITSVNDNIDVTVGEKVTVQFKVNLATGSNAGGEDLLKNHDIWCRCSAVPRSELSVNGDIFEVTYTAGVKESVDYICLWADDVKSDRVTVNTKLSQLTDDSGEIKTDEEVGDALKNILNNASENPTDAVESLKTVYATENEDVKREVQEKFLDKDMQDQLKKLEDNYAEANRIENLAPEISGEGVADAVGEVTVTGAALNADPGDFVQLKVDAPKDDDYTIEGNYKIKAAFDIALSIQDATGNEKGDSILRIPVIITMNLPEGFTAGDKLFNLHGDEQIEVKFKIVGSKIHFVTDRFSTYVFAAENTSDNDDTPSSGGSSSSGSGGGGGGSRRNVNSELNTGLTSNSQSGNWIKDANGWWIRLKDGTYPINTWKYLDFNGVYDWYYFDSMGYMSTGWYIDTDGNRYYLNPVSDGTMGAMATGWRYIDGYWYYFNPISDGKQGALLVNTTTPDGYVVNGSGQWIP